MTRPGTTSTDSQILAMLDQGRAPKEIARLLRLKNASRVYNAIRRRKAICKK